MAMAHAQGESSGAEGKKSIPRRIADWFVWFCKDQWFLIGVAVAIVIASQVQVPASQQDVKQTVTTYLSGLGLDSAVFFQQYKRIYHHLFIQLSCFFVISALAFAVVSATASNPQFLDPWLLIGLIFNGSQPTTIASNVMFTRQGHGNSALTVVETTIGNFLGPFLSPVLIRMYLLSNAWYTKVVPPQHGGYGALYRRVFMQLGLSIYLPLVVGQVVRWFFPNATKKVCTDWKGSKLGSIALLFLLWQTFDHIFSTDAFAAVAPDNLVFIVFIIIGNYGLWITISFLTSRLWMERRDVVSACMCIPAKTLALGIPLSFLLFEGVNSEEVAKLQVPIVLYQVLQIAMSSLSTLWFRGWVDRGAKKEQDLEKATSDGTSSPTEPAVHDDSTERDLSVPGDEEKK